MTTAIRYTATSDPMWEEHERTVDAACTCDYTRIRNGLYKTLAIHRDTDKNCPAHQG